MMKYWKKSGLATLLLLVLSATEANAVLLDDVTPTSAGAIMAVTNPLMTRSSTSITVTGTASWPGSIDFAPEPLLLLTSSIIPIAAVGGATAGDVSLTATRLLPPPDALFLSTTMLEDVRVGGGVLDVLMRVNPATPAADIFGPLIQMQLTAPVLTASFFADTLALTTAEQVPVGFSAFAVEEIATQQVASVPLPGAAWLLIGGLASLALRHRRGRADA